MNIEGGRGQPCLAKANDVASEPGVLPSGREQERGSLLRLQLTPGFLVEEQLSSSLQQKSGQQWRRHSCMDSKKRIP